jgi:hypothetical protein
MNDQVTTTNTSGRTSFEELLLLWGSSILICIWLGVFLAIFSLFNKITVSGLAGFAVMTPIAYLIKKRKLAVSLPRVDIMALIVITLLTAFSVFYFHDTYFGGRDDGVYANAAVYLAEHHTLFITNPLAQTFPGFVQSVYGSVMQFFPGYTAWIAILSTLFGRSSIIFSNAPLLFLGLASFYLVCKRIIKPTTALAALIILGTTFPFLWFTRKTFSENLAFFLTWYGLLAYLSAWETKRTLPVVIAFLSFAILLTVRIESVALVIMLLAMVIMAHVSKKHTVINSMSFLFFALALLPALFYYAFIDTRYVGEIASKLTDLVHHTPVAPAAAALPEEAPDPSYIQFNQPTFVFFLLQLYNFGYYILSIPMALLLSIKRYASKSSTTFRIIFFILLPNVYFLLNPQINLDQPWFLRRYMIAIIPLGIASLLFMAERMPRRILGLIAILAIFINLYITAPVLFFREYHGAVSELAQADFPRLISDQLLLVDYASTGHYKLAEPLFFLYGINAAAINSSSLLYSQGLAPTVNSTIYTDKSFSLPKGAICSYHDIYLLSAQNGPILTELNAENSVTEVTKIPLKYDELVKTCELFRVAKDVNAEQMAHVTLDTALSYCSELPSYIYQSKQNLSLYRFNDDYANSLKSNLCTPE